jgi:hypothetical protein
MFIVSIEKKSCSYLFVSKFTFISETSGIFLLLLHEKQKITQYKEINIFFIPQIKGKKRRVLCYLKKPLTFYSANFAE